VIEGAFAKRSFRQSEFASYTSWVQRGVRVYRSFVRDFYHPAFVELLIRPSDFMGLRAAVTGLLAGHGLERKDIVLRVALFRLLARLNRHIELVPRLPERRAAFVST
jgi:hypothetical protein